MSVLTKNDIISLLNKDILIYPLRERTIKGSSINLTISKLAWSLNQKESIYNDESNTITIPKNDTALIESEESLHVSSRIAGTFHSRVSFVSRGLSHIGTTLDPEWIGSCLIAIHNHSGQDITLKVGEEMVTIMLYYVETPAIGNNTNTHGRPELLKQYNLTIEEDRWLDEDWRKNVKSLREKMETDSVFQKLISSKKTIIKNSSKKSVFNILLLFAILVLLSFLFQKSERLLAIDKILLLAIMGLNSLLLLTNLKK